MNPAAAFGVSFLPGAPADVASWSRVAESLGYARVGIGDSPAGFRDPWMTLAVVAAATSRIPIGIWVTNPVTRDPLVTADAAATLDELAPGRTFIGIATGDSGLSGAGHQPATLGDLDAYVRAVRDLLERGEAVHHGLRSRLSWPGRPRRIPIYLAAHGERSIRLAGAIADGAVMGLGISPDVIERCLGLLGAGAAGAGRKVSEIDVWWTVRYLVGEAPGAAREEMAGILAEAAHVLARTAFRFDPGPDHYQPAIEQLASEFDRRGYGDTDPATRRQLGRRAFELGIGEHLVERYAFAGTPAECAEQIGRAVASGARQFMYSMRGPDRERRLHEWHDLVVERLPRPPGG